MKYLLLR